MAITITQHLQRADAYLNHWTQVNALLGATPLVLRGNYALAQLTTDRNTLAAALLAVQDALNNQQTHAARRDERQAALRERLKQLRSATLGRMAGSEYVGALPRLPHASASPTTYTTALDDMATLWARINAAPPAGVTGPLLLAGGHTLATFTTDLTALKATYTALADAQQGRRNAQAQRDTLTQSLRARLIAYRLAVPSVLPTAHPLLASLPSL